MRLAADLGGLLVFAQPLVDDLAQQVVVGPGQVFDFGDKIGPHPMHAAQNERRAEPAVARRRHVERHLGRRQGLEAAPLLRSITLSGVSAPIPLSERNR